MHTFRETRPAELRATIGQRPMRRNRLSDLSVSSGGQQSDVEARRGQQPDVEAQRGQRRAAIGQRPMRRNRLSDLSVSSGEQQSDVEARRGQQPDVEAQRGQRRAAPKRPRTPSGGRPLYSAVGGPT